MVVMASTGIGLASMQLIQTVGVAASAPDWNLPAVKVEVDWQNNGTWSDESQNCRQVAVSRGRARINDVFTAGTATVTLRNLDGRYSPFSPLTPLSPNVVGNRPIRIHASYRGVIYAVYQGLTSEIQQTVAFREAAVAITCIDAFEAFRLSNKAAAKQTNQRVDQIIQAILTAVGWTGGVSLDTGATLTSYTQPNGSTLVGLQNAAQQDVIGKVYMTADGKVRFENASARAHNPVWHVFQSVEALQVNLRQSDLIASVEATYNTSGMPNAPAQALTTLTASFTVGATVPAPGAITIVASDHADGSGLNVSAQVWVRSISVTGAAATIVIYNDLPYTAYIQSVAGNGIGALTAPVAVVTAGGPLVGSQVQTETFDYVVSQATITDWAQRTAAALRTQHPRPIVQVVGRTPELTHILLGADLGTRIVLQDTGLDPLPPQEAAQSFPLLPLQSAAGRTAPWLSNMTGQFFIEALTLTLGPRQVPTAQWSLFDSSQGVL